MHNSIIPVRHAGIPFLDSIPPVSLPLRAEYWRSHSVIRKWCEKNYVDPLLLFNVGPKGFRCIKTSLRTRWSQTSSSIDNRWRIPTTTPKTTRVWAECSHLTKQMISYFLKKKNAGSNWKQSGILSCPTCPACRFGGAIATIEWLRTQSHNLYSQQFFFLSEQSQENGQLILSESRLKNLTKPACKSLTINLWSLLIFTFKPLKKNVSQWLMSADYCWWLTDFRGSPLACCLRCQASNL